MFFQLSTHFSTHVSTHFCVLFFCLILFSYLILFSVFSCLYSIYQAIATLPDRILHPEPPHPHPHPSGGASYLPHNNHNRRGKKDEVIEQEFPIISLPITIQSILYQHNVEYFLSLVHHLYTSTVNGDLPQPQHQHGGKKRNKKSPARRRHPGHTDPSATMRGLSLMEFIILLGSVALQVKERIYKTINYFS